MPGEVLPPAQSLANMIHAEITGPLAELDNLMSKAALAKLYDCLAPFNQLAVPDDDGFVQHQQLTDNVPQASNKNIGYARATYLFGMVSTGVSTRYDLQVSSAEPKAAHIFKNGYDKMLAKSLEQNDAQQTEPYFITFRTLALPLTLLSIAQDALAEYTPTPEAVNERLCADMAQVALNKKFGIPKRASAPEELYYNCLNLLRQNYHAPNEKVFIKQLIAQQYFVRHPRYESGLALAGEGYASSIQQDIKALGMDMSIADIKKELLHLFRHVDMTLIEKHGLEKELKIAEKTDSSRAMTTVLDGAFGGSQDHSDAMLEEFGLITAKRPEFIARVQSMFITRSVVDGLAQGALDFSLLPNLVQLLKSKPLADRAPREKPRIDEIWYPWEIAPAAIGTGVSGGTHASPSGERQPAEWDIKRKAWVEDWVKLWGGGLIGRSQIPGLPEERQYYVALLPQEINSLTLYHGVGDNPEEGHGIKVWRAEQGIGPFDNVQIDIETAYRVNKMVMRFIGMKTIKHVGDQDRRVLEFLTRRVDQLDDPRYRM